MEQTFHTSNVRLLQEFSLFYKKLCFQSRLQRSHEGQAYHQQPEVQWAFPLHTMTVNSCSLWCLKPTDGLSGLSSFQDQGSSSQHPVLSGPRGQVRRVDEPPGPSWRERHAREVLAGARCCWAQDPSGQVSRGGLHVFILTVYYKKKFNVRQ